MYGNHMDGWDWLFGSLMMLSWAIVLGVVVYVAVRLAQGTGRR